MEKATSREKGQPLCMAQYYRLMKSYREPGLVKDRLLDVESDLTISRPHIIVACKSQVFSMFNVVQTSCQTSEKNVY